MSPLPTQMRDRWASRAEPAAGHGTVYWHILMSRHPEARSAAAAAHEALAEFTGLHLTPNEWLHMTVHVAGSTDDIGGEQLDNVLRQAGEAVSSVAPLRVTLERVLYHPEAIMLAVEPADRLRAVQQRIRGATASALGAACDARRGDWTPHVTVAYSTAEQPTEPLIAALGRSVPPARFVIDTISLVVQWGPERRWDWETVGVAKLGGSVAD